MRFLLTVYLSCIITGYTKDFGYVAICRAIEQFIGGARASKILMLESPPTASYIQILIIFKFRN